MSYRTHTIDEFLSAVASQRRTPAGGASAAVVGAIGSTLCEMGCLHTLMRDEHVESVLSDVRETLQTQRDHLMSLAKTDSIVVDSVFDSGIENVSESDQKRAVGVPLTIANTCGNVLESGIIVIENATRSVVADVATGMFLTYAAFNAAVCIVRVNLVSLPDSAFHREMTDRILAFEKAATERYDHTQRIIDERL